MWAESVLRIYVTQFMDCVTLNLLSVLQTSGFGALALVITAILTFDLTVSLVSI